MTVKLADRTFVDGVLVGIAGQEIDDDTAAHYGIGEDGTPDPKRPEKPDAYEGEAALAKWHEELQAYRDGEKPKRRGRKPAASETAADEPDENAAETGSDF
jgi:hypothetical protein